MELFSALLGKLIAVFLSQKQKIETPIQKELKEIIRLRQNLIVMQLGK